MTIRVLVPISGGKDSQAALKLALQKYQPDEVRGLFCDTRFEHPLTYAHVEKLRTLYGEVQIDTVCGGSVLEKSIKYGRFPGGGARHCTDELKIYENSGLCTMKQDETMSQYSIIHQPVSSPEIHAVLHAAMLTDIPTQALSSDRLGSVATALRDGLSLPIGSVEYVREAMRVAGIDEPENVSYPESLRNYLCREVRLQKAGSILGHWFIKPTTTKAFTGFVFDTLENPEDLSEYSRAQYNIFLALPPETLVWVSEPVDWQSEHRYYVLDGKILGEGRYDDAPDDMPTPDMVLVGEMALALARSKDAPVAFSLDVGVLSTGETALVECNDAWALGYYKGTLSSKGYTHMLWQRWVQLLLISEMESIAPYIPEFDGSTH